MSAAPAAASSSAIPRPMPRPAPVTTATRPSSIFMARKTTNRSVDCLRMGPLDGIRVLDLTRLLPGAFATALLADLGADVIKIEQPGTGDPMRAYEPKIGEASAFTWVTDRNKRSVELNLREDAGRDALLALAETADALVESFRPGVMDRLGLGYDTLAERNPKLVYCSISG